jgi:Flp pilus assembly protein TadG
VGFALVAPLLFLLILGPIEFGRAMMVSNVMTNTARDAVRTAVLPNGSNKDVEAAAVSRLEGAGVPTTDLKTTVRVHGTEKDASTAVTGDAVTVIVTVPYKDVSWLPTNLFISDGTLAGHAVMRRE